MGVAMMVAPRAQAQSSGDGFLFSRPGAALTLHGGYAHANAGSDIFSFSTKNLTLGKGDFSGFDGGADLAVALSSRVDLAFGVDYTGRVAGSEYRDFVGTDNLPIQQTTRFQRVPVTANVKAYLTPRGRSIGKFAWIPAKLAPFVGAGGGAMWYRFSQSGEFVDFNTDNYDIFNNTLESSGWAPMAQGFVGADLTLTPRLALTGQAGYSWAKAQLSDQFVDFEPIDLSGPSATLGLTVRF
jgi:hypothetical protein